MSRPLRNDPRATQTVKVQLRLRQMILDGELRAGERVPELSVVEATGVSRTPIRAALLQLAEEGLLDALPTGGFAVRAFAEDEVFDAIDLRGTLEGAAARRAAARRLSHAQLAGLRDCVAALDAVTAHHQPGPEQLTDYVRLNERFHALLIELADSNVLRRAIERITALPFASPSAFVQAQAHLPDAGQTLIIGQEHHRAILDALAAGDGARAESVAREHSTLASRNFRSVVRSHDGPLSLVAGSNLVDWSARHPRPR